MRRLTGAFKNVAHNSPAYDAVFRNFSGLGHQSMYLKKRLTDYLTNYYQGDKMSLKEASSVDNI
jgi:hypothetical protein